MSFWLTITDGEDVVLGRVRLDGYDLFTAADRTAVGEEVAAQMGGRAAAECAKLPPPEEES